MSSPRRRPATLMCDSTNIQAKCRVRLQSTKRDHNHLLATIRHRGVYLGKNVQSAKKKRRCSICGSPCHKETKLNSHGRNCTKHRVFTPLPTRLAAAFACRSGWRKVKTKEGKTRYVNDVEQIISRVRPVAIASPAVATQHRSEARVDKGRVMWPL